MKTLALIPGKINGPFGILATMIAMVLAFSVIAIQVSSADIPDVRPADINGMYKVSQSSDPIFPMVSGKEWFLDFGDGTLDGSVSGKVAVSLRENPNVKVRILVWQYFPDERALVIGNQFEEGSGGAVAKGVWELQNDLNDVHLTRSNHSVVLARAASTDF